MTRHLTLAKVEDKTLGQRYIFTNICAISSQDFPSRDGTDVYLLLNGRYVVSGRPTPGFPPGCISLSEPQRQWAGIGNMDAIEAEVYDPISDGGNNYLGALDVEIDFAVKGRGTEDPFDPDELAAFYTSILDGQIFAPGQRFIMDYKSYKLLFVIKTVQLMNLNNEKPGAIETSPNARGILTNQTPIAFYKAGGSPIKLKGSSKRPAANSIIAPDFKFENMGIGGLDKEFSNIFRRAFASRIFPPGLIEKLGINHVKGILLYGPPGTGKTLIARQIGKMLNSREPKVINGPEVLNKFVGQSEENIRKLFADAEKEYKEKGDESELHIIIFDELDAVCKQRGSGAGGGTGVGDSVVNQLLSKLDGVDQLNNILMIGMTNRKDMIDDALLRPGRLEVHMEISLPDEHGRAQILKIQTSKMKDNGTLDDDVDLPELAALTKNFSGAELGGLVRNASSNAMNRHVKVGTVAGVSDDVENIKLQRNDFLLALQECKAAFGVSEEQLATALRGGVIRYSPFIDSILQDGQRFVNQVRNSASEPLLSVLLHGPSGSGKTALAAKIAIDSEFPFIKLASPEDMVGMGEMQRVQFLNKVFSDAYKSPQNVIVVDNIERIIDWSPIGPRFANPVLQALMVLLTKQPPEGKRLLILATTSQRSVVQQLDLFSCFDREIPVPNVNSHRELATILREVSAFGSDTENKIVGALNELRDITGTDEVGVGIKRVLRNVETARADQDGPRTFADAMAKTRAMGA